MKKLILWLVGFVVLAGAGLAAFLMQFKPELTPFHLEKIEATAKKSGMTDCFWAGVVSQGEMAVYPDTAATYWYSQFSLPKGAKLSFKAQFPHARHLSYNVYDPQSLPMDRLNDTMIVPDAGSTNPFPVGARRDDTARNYTFHIVEGDVKAGMPMEEIDAKRPANTLFMPNLGQPLRILMRVYVPDQGLNANGGVPLPVPTLKLADGKEVTGDALCKQLVVKDGMVAQAVLNKTATQKLLHQNNSQLPYAPAEAQPRWYSFYNPTRTLTIFFKGTALEFLEKILPTNRKGGFFSTIDNTYMSTMMDNRYGDVMVITGKPPKTPHTLAGEKVMEPYDMRFWSYCQYNSLHDPKVQQCVYDEQAPLDADGNYTIAISTAANRPSNAKTECGVAWMDWGTEGDNVGNPHGGMLIYRHMLPDPKFKQSLFETRTPGDEAQVLGPYFPKTRYMSRAEFEKMACKTTATKQSVAK